MANKKVLKGFGAFFPDMDDQSNKKSIQKESSVGQTHQLMLPRMSLSHLIMAYIPITKDPNPIRKLNTV